MTDFSFTSTAKCDICGQFLNESDEDCDHNGREVHTHVFRIIGEGHDSMTGVQSTTWYKWRALEEKVGEEWKQYEWLGPRESVETMLNGPIWESISELPSRSLSIDAPDELWDDS